MIMQPCRLSCGEEEEEEGEQVQSLDYDSLQWYA